MVDTSGTLQSSGCVPLVALLEPLFSVLLLDVELLQTLELLRINTQFLKQTFHLPGVSTTRAPCPKLDSITIEPDLIVGQTDTAVILCC